MASALVEFEKKKANEKNFKFNEMFSYLKNN